VNKVAEAEKTLLTFMREEKSEVRDAILNSKELTSQTEDALKAALEAFRTRTQQAAAGAKAAVAV
jgi:F-type H+-transporting ATPase subunit alpha